MTHYYEQLVKVKKLKNSNFMKIYYEKYIIELRPIDYSKNTVKLLTDWRKKSQYMFGTNFTISEERTKNWIKNRIIENHESFLAGIFIDDKLVGHMGVDKYNEKTNVAELENYMKDPLYNFPGLITIVERPFLKWLFDYLRLSKIVTHVFSDNYKIINVHLRCGGWTISKTITLKRIDTPDGWKWEKTELKSPDEIAERYFLEMEITRENLMKNFDDAKFEILVQ